VHPEYLEKQKIPPALRSKHIWKERFEDIGSFERYLGRNGIIVVKFFLHVSKNEQKRRFLERAEEPEKNWKFSGSDMAERDHWDEYQDAYEDMIRNTATKHSPWFVVPADKKWFARVVVSAAVIDTLVSLDLAYPEVDSARLADITKAKEVLLRSK
jgi:polyphosphate kinase 2 (PPK2 family)